jgi:hypothetical protein
MASKVVVAEYSAEGGPEKPFMAPDGHEAVPTEAGEYRIAYCTRHRSRRYPQWSSIPWGSPLKLDGDRLLVHLDGRWQDVFKLAGVTPSGVESYHQLLYGTEKIPEKWVFNDFGHLTCYMFKDLNRNGRLDPPIEKISGEFFHTTPPDEAATSLHRPVRLGPSHGCIHLKPLELDDMVRRKFMRKGARVVVHGYDELLVRYPRVQLFSLMSFTSIRACTSF